MIPFQSQLIAAGVAAVIAFGAAWKIQGWRYGATINEMEASSASVLAEATKAAREAENAIAARSNRIEADYVTAKTENARLLAANRKLGRLRDPYASCTDAMPGDSEAGVSTDKPTGAEFSAEATDFLREFAYQCDEAAQYSVACKKWADGL